MSAPQTTNASSTVVPLAGAKAEPAPQRFSPFVPVLLSTLAVLAVLGWQAWVLGSEREVLSASHAGQQQTVESAAKLRTSLDALAADTQRLADAGNPNAALLVTELKKRGITINPQAPAAAAASAPR